MQRSVNRVILDPALDDLDHALGRPSNPLKPTYRDHFVAETDTDLARTMDASPWWRRGRDLSGGLVCFFVTLEGRQALAKAINIRGS